MDFSTSTKRDIITSRKHFRKTFLDLTHQLQFSLSTPVLKISDPTFSRGAGVENFTLNVPWTCVSPDLICSPPTFWLNK